MSTMPMAQRDYVVFAVIAVLCAGVFTATYPTADLPGIGRLPLLKLTALAALAGFPLLWFLQRQGVGRTAQPIRITWLILLGAALSIPPILIDLFIGFPRDMNAPIPESFFFYTAAALVAEVLFHLLPLAILTAPLRTRAAGPTLFVPVVFVEPTFQAISSTGPALLNVLVFANVSLVGAAQLWLFSRHGFGAMIGLRLTFYLFWHVIWGTLRLWGQA